MATEERAQPKTAKPWAGGFRKGTAPAVEAYTASIAYDWRLYRHDIAGSIAHARMLGDQGIIPASDADRIIDGLRQIEQEIETGVFPFREELEDIHMNVEARLIELIGEAAGRLHTARSRNDQVALDMRLYVKEAIGETVRRITALEDTLLQQSEAHLDTVLPGYTHLQRAQPVLLAHHLLAYVEMLERDIGRLNDARCRTDVMPLGSGALAGSPYPLDREAVARALGFSRISRNSLDAVSDRDFVVEYEAAAATCMMHLSRMAEEIILWSSQEFGFIELDDAYATGSSLMPQKRNPDVAELARGRTGRVYGHLMAMLTTLKGIPLSYNRDLQEDKEGIFDTVDTLAMTLEVMTGLMESLVFRRERMAEAASGGYLLATDLADYLTHKGMPFREAHGVVARLVRLAEERRVGFDKLDLATYRSASTLFDEDVYQVTAQAAIAARDVPGGTAQNQVQARLLELKGVIQARHAGT